ADDTLYVATGNAPSGDFSGVGNFRLDCTPIPPTRYANAAYWRQFFAATGDANLNIPAGTVVAYPGDKDDFFLSVVRLGVEWVFTGSSSSPVTPTLKVLDWYQPYLGNAPRGNDPTENANGDPLNDPQSIQ